MSYLRGLFAATEDLNRQVLLDLVEARPGGRLLDCGCDDGAFAVRLAERARVSEVHGVELFVPAATAAAARGVHVQTADLNHGLAYPDGSFDLVHANQVIEHLHDTDLFLREIRRVLRADGLALLSTNNLASWHNVASLLLGFQPMPLHASNEVILGNPCDPLRGDRHPHPGRAHHRVFAWRGLLELCRHHRLLPERALSAGYYPLPPRLAKLAVRMDPWHGCYLTFRLRPI